MTGASIEDANRTWYYESSEETTVKRVGLSRRVIWKILPFQSRLKNVHFAYLLNSKEDSEERRRKSNNGGDYVFDATRNCCRNGRGNLRVLGMFESSEALKEEIEIERFARFQSVRFLALMSEYLWNSVEIYSRVLRFKINHQTFNFIILKFFLIKLPTIQEQLNQSSRKSIFS